MFNQQQLVKNALKLIKNVKLDIVYLKLACNSLSKTLGELKVYCIFKHCVVYMSPTQWLTLTFASPNADNLATENRTKISIDPSEVDMQVCRSILNLFSPL